MKRRSVGNQGESWNARFGDRLEVGAIGSLLSLCSMVDYLTSTHEYIDLTSCKRGSTRHMSISRILSCVSPTVQTREKNTLFL